MRKIYVLTAIALLTACSAPKKYSYYFDHTTVKPKSVVQEQTSQPVQVLASADPSIVATVESTPSSIISEPEKKVNVKASPKENRLVKKEAKQQIKSLIKEFKKKPEGTTATKADAKKNGFAIAGFIVSIVGFLVFWPLCIVGLILSAIGLKSERRGLAIAGLVVGVVALAIVLALGAAIVAA
ncbi:MAG TPA: DUF4190 domain-containing protein [Cyclobacteriaceae bacterium]|nr:DUF4190 domain-containing protein [Cyclobacteriaceae bacterium]